MIIEIELEKPEINAFIEAVATLSNLVENFEAAISSRRNKYIDMDSVLSDQEKLIIKATIGIKKAMNDH